MSRAGRRGSAPRCGAGHRAWAREAARRSCSDSISRTSCRQEHGRCPEGDRDGNQFDRDRCHGCRRVLARLCCVSRETARRTTAVPAAHCSGAPNAEETHLRKRSAEPVFHVNRTRGRVPAVKHTGSGGAARPVAAQGPYCHGPMGRKRAENDQVGSPHRPGEWLLWRFRTSKRAESGARIGRVAQLSPNPGWPSSPRMRLRSPMVAKSTVSCPFREVSLIFTEVFSRSPSRPAISSR